MPVDEVSGRVVVTIAPPLLTAVGEAEATYGLLPLPHETILSVTPFHTTPLVKENQRPMSPTRNSGDLYEVMTDTWGSSPPIYPKGHILSADTIAPGRDLAWAIRVGAVKILAEDDPRQKDGPSPEPGDMLMAGDDGWSDPAFPYQAPVSRAESEQFAAAVRASEAGATADATAAAAAEAAENAKVTADAASATKQRAQAAAKAAAAALKVAEKQGEERDPSSADIQAGADPGGVATGPLVAPVVAAPPPVSGTV